MPMIATTIISSIRVKPCWILFTKTPLSLGVRARPVDSRTYPLCSKSHATNFSAGRVESVTAGRPKHRNPAILRQPMPNFVSAGLARIDQKAFGGRSALPRLPHDGIGGLQVPPEAVGIEKRGGTPSPCQLCPQRAQSSGVAG